MTLYQPLSTDGYSISKAYIFFQPTGDDAFINLGDADLVEIATEVEKVERFQRNEGLKTKVLTVVTQIDVALTMTLLQASPFNRALSLLGDTAPFTQSLDAAHLQTIVGGGILGIFQLDASFVSSLSITDGATTTPYVLGTDYFVDLVGGFVQIIAIPGGADADLKITYDIDAVIEADGKDVVTVASNSNIRGKLVVRGAPEVGPNLLLELHDVLLSPSGNRAYIADAEFDTIEIEGEIFSDSTQAAGFELGRELLLA